VHTLFLSSVVMLFFFFAGKLVMLIAQVLSVSCTVGTPMQVTAGS
jgi:hypothetical protein